MCKPVAWDTKPIFSWYKSFGSVLASTPSGSRWLPRSQDKLSSAQPLERRREQSGRDGLCRGHGVWVFWAEVGGCQLCGSPCSFCPAVGACVGLVKGCPGRRAVWVAAGGSTRAVPASGCQGVQRRRDTKLGVKHRERPWTRLSESWFWHKIESESAPSHCCCRRT